MMLLYGNRKRLFGRWQVLMAAYDHTLFPIFAVQVAPCMTALSLCLYPKLVCNLTQCRLQQTFSVYCPALTRV